MNYSSTTVLTAHIVSTRWLTVLRVSTSGGVPVQQTPLFWSFGSTSKAAYDPFAAGKCIGDISLLQKQQTKLALSCYMRN